MALAVASTSTASSNNADTVVVTAPSGIQVGDLLLILPGTYGTSLATSTGFTQVVNESRNRDSIAEQICGLNLLYKIAVSADTSAPNYTVTFATNSGGAVSMLRVTGWTIGNPIFLSDTQTSDPNATFTINESVSLARPTQQLLLMASIVSRTDDPSATTASYQITSSDSNPTWTELQDVTFQSNNATDTAFLRFSMAYAISSNTSSITNWGFTTTMSSTAVAQAGIFAIIATPQDVTADVSHVSVAPTVESVTATQVNVTPDVSHLAITPTISGIEADNTSDHTQWTNADKPTEPTWINTDK